MYAPPPPYSIRGTRRGSAGWAGTGGAVALALGRAGAGPRAIGTVDAPTTGRPGEAARIRCPAWAGAGSDDPVMPAAQRDACAAETQGAGVDRRLVVCGGAPHAFHHPPVDRTVVPGVGTTPGTRNGPGATSSACSPRACRRRSDRPAGARAVPGSVFRIRPDQGAGSGACDRKAEEGANAERWRPTTTRRACVPGPASPA
ncbi:hypothetical protein GCM10010274_32480 [Streptomyces lavendofoliae]|uniref:Uncharacterized protein n=1 Tax=Streptomyces lavendofoliae TaxID=67314 RepID=A0A918M5E2_9ACTN|nr:hypothetical protein GCM10010274_32480 [Streptomyces lavendofoliae]